MYFRALLTADTNFDLSTKEPLIFQLTTPRDISAEIRQDDSSGNVLITYEEPVDSETDQLLLHWETKKWPEDENAKKALAGLFDRHRQLTYDTANHILQTLRWRTGDVVQNDELSQPALSYSRDGGTWVSFPPPKPIGLPRPRIARKWNTDELVSETVAIINNGSRLPIAIELLEEAYKLSESAPRSAAVLGVSALEVAIKSFVSTHVPKASWLIEKLPSPDVLKILREYAPRLCDRNPCPPSSVRKRLTNAVELRNQIVHGGKEGPPYQELQDMLCAIEDTIWLLEFCSGFERAWSFIWGETHVDYKIEWLQEMVSKIPDLSDKEQQQLRQAIPSLLRLDHSTPNAIKRLTEMQQKLPKQFMDSLSPHLASEVVAELSPGSPPAAAKMIEFRQRLPRVPKIG
jgi:hypothetical protein